MKKREARNFYIYTAPWLIGFLVLTLYPILYSFYLMFTNMNLTGIGEFVGLDNWKYAFTDDTLFRRAFLNTLKYVFMFVPCSIILAFFVALLLSKKVKGLGFFRTAFYIPYITSGVAVTILWGWIFQKDFGIINYILSLVGIKGPNWLGDKNIARIFPGLIMKAHRLTGQALCGRHSISHCLCVRLPYISILLSQ